MPVRIVGAFTLVLLLVLCGTLFWPSDTQTPENFPVLDSGEMAPETRSAAERSERATMGAGCFWCIEAAFQQLRGVQSVTSGYSGGSVKNPTYEQVCSETTGHAEVVQITYDPTVITYAELLEAFWRSHDPTTRNRQGRDVGTQYRSAIFYHSQRQRVLAELYKQKIDNAHVFASPLVTEITAFTAFYPADAEHQNYFAANPRKPYCQMVIAPKLDKFRKVFHDKLKPNRE